jgi:hypothetical protein
MSLTLEECISRQRAPYLLLIIIAASCALLFTIVTNKLFNSLNLNREITISLYIEGSVYYIQIEIEVTDYLF